MAALGARRRGEDDVGHETASQPVTTDVVFPDGGFLVYRETRPWCFGLPQIERQKGPKAPSLGSAPDFVQPYKA